MPQRAESTFLVLADFLCTHVLAARPPARLRVQRGRVRHPFIVFMRPCVVTSVSHRERAQLCCDIDLLCACFA